MSLPKLNSYELEAIFKWIDGYTLSRPSKKLSRDFSDAVLLAEILKFEFAKLVELHNYPACNSVQGKMKNWDALNRKVLKKLSINLRQEEIEKLAKGETTFIEEVLFHVMNKVRQAKALELSQSKKSIGDNKLQSDIMTVTVTKQVGDHVENIPQQMIQLTIYDDLLAKFEEQQMLVKELNERIHDLEIASNTKSQIIAELEERINEKRHKKTSISSLKESIANFF
ncbi:hypothetical protein PVAND_011553 [Polypedilum vanderplanki]|uniref:Calponin-homology (CH) domain-containing protein n=1 Tax=Polypedilum vanderplanki TaxID=319348 RepID=A0A9J6CIZ1_POLVA|nr:hypothetical protein PVAND_011553 [Polypedilum vanderplanki]